MMSGAKVQKKLELLSDVTFSYAHTGENQNDTRRNYFVPNQLRKELHKNILFNSSLYSYKRMK